MRRGLAAFLVLGLVGSTVTAAEPTLVGRKVDDFTLKSHFGKEYSLSQVGDRKVVVVVFLGAECPLAKLYGRRLSDLSREFKGKSVAFLGIDSNRQDSLEEIAAYAHRHQIKFPILKDAGNVVADAMGAERTPEVFVLDRDRVVRYHGRIDDQYGFVDGVGYQRPAPTREDLVHAVKELLKGDEVQVASTEFVGCRIGRVREVNEDADVTYSKEIARIFQRNCVECHRAGMIGPFEMTSYEDVVGWGEMIREVVDAGRMPPWHADPQHGHFKNAMSLTNEEKEQIADWVENGCPEGDPADLPEPTDYVEGWAIGEPDQVVNMNKSAVSVPAEGVIDYYHFVVDPGWKEDKWIMAAEARPGSFETVHHILVFLLPPDAQGEGGFRGRGGGIGGGNLIAGYAPGMNPLIQTDGKTAIQAKAGSKLIFQLHYTPNGSPQKDMSYCGFKFADPEQVEFVARSTSVANFLFNIPAGAEAHQATAETEFASDVMLTSMTPHMHTRGKAFRYEVTYPSGEKEILLDVPSYDFNWQTSYQLDEPKKIPAGSHLLCTATWDNSEANLSNPDPTKNVTWGDQTWEEMMIGFYVEVYPKGEVPETPSGGRGLGRLDPDKLFDQLDANKDGKLVPEEMPSRLAERFNLVDLNRDGSLSKQELQAIIKLFSRGRGDRR